MQVNRHQYKNFFATEDVSKISELKSHFLGNKSLRVKLLSLNSKVIVMNDKIAVIGSGMMGGAIIKSLVKGGYEGKLTAVDIALERLKEFESLGVKTSTDNKKAAGDADIVFIIVKPGDVAKVLKEINTEIKDKLLVSVAATVPLKFLRKNAPEARIVRIMPNLGALVQAAYTAYCCEPNVTAQDKEKVKTLLNMFGICDELDEKYLDAITALSGSGPGYMSIIVEALTYAGLKVGLPRNIALNCAAQTVMGNRQTRLRPK